jgi:hypothetical protein
LASLINKEATICISVKGKSYIGFIGADSFLQITEICWINRIRFVIWKVAIKFVIELDYLCIQ